ncbi:MAG TPA: GAF domain-containing protein, partial [Rhodocyclaceae bacterium]|nr:GAF domain-containing protein [Rhodocyclaceae bacterium]
MNDLVLLAGNSLIGCLFIGMWYAERQRGYFAYWGAAHILLGISAIMALMMRMPEFGITSILFKVMITPISALGFATMIGGSLRYRKQSFTWRDTLVLAVGYSALAIGTRYAYPPAMVWIVCIALAISLSSIAWALWRDSLLEKIAAFLFALRAANGVWLAASGGLFVNSPQTPISHLLSLSAAICLLLAVFQRKSNELGHNNELLTFSNQLITALQIPTDERNLAEEALHQLTRNMPSHRAMIHLMDSSEQWFELIAAQGHSPEVMAVVRRMPVDSTLSGQAVRMRKTVFAQDYASEPGAWQELAVAYAKAGIVA